MPSQLTSAFVISLEQPTRPVTVFVVNFVYFVLFVFQSYLEVSRIDARSHGTFRNRRHTTHDLRLTTHDSSCVLIPLEPHHRQPPILIAIPQQLGLGSHADDPTRSEHHDPVCEIDGGQAVGDDEGDPIVNDL